MSVFKGSITEYPGVIVDHFTPFNCNRGRAFFLSHCHKDHMTGLNSPQIVDSLQRRKSNLFCSEVTRSLLLQDPGFTQLAPYLRGLPMDEPVPMNLEAQIDAPALNFTVTLLPAGHCPGSSMFFYQGSNGSVLYTGDFRLSLEETKRLKSLHCGERLLDIKSLYLDTTFCHPIATTIPSREVSRQHVLKIADSWLSKDQHNVLHLQLGMFGYEHIYMGLARRFNTKVHIARWRLRAYKDLPAVADCLTMDGESTRIHACQFRKGQNRCMGVPCGSRCSNGRPPFVRSIKPSTIWFLSNSGTLSEPYKYLPESNVYRVLHSMHASYTELCNFITYIKPSRIVPCVVPLGDKSLADVNVRLKSLLPQVEVVTSTEALPFSITSSKTKEDRTQKFTDLDECSNDTIDDFASSQEGTPEKTNISSSPKHLALPSLFTDTTFSGILDDIKQDCIPESLGSSSNATLGSLEQTPIDLSPEHTPAELDISMITTDSQKSSEGELKSVSYCVRCKSPESFEVEVINIVTPGLGDVAGSEISAALEDTVYYDPDETIDLTQHSSSSADDWHLTLESSIDERESLAELSQLENRQGDHKAKEQQHTGDETEPEDSTFSSDQTVVEETYTPEPKRIKLDNEDHHTLHMTTNNTDHQDREKRSPSVEIIEHRDIGYIDLTQDQSSSSSSRTHEECVTSSQRTINSNSSRDEVEHCEDSERQCVDSDSQRGEVKQNVDPKDFVSPRQTRKESTSKAVDCNLAQSASVECSPSNSRHSRSLSPLCLPPTPGREKVDSILERKSIAF